MHQIHEVAPFKYTYRLFNRVTRQYTGEFDTAVAAYDHMKKTTDRRSPFNVLSDKITAWVEPIPYKTKWGSISYYGKVEGWWVIVTNIGDVVSSEETHAAWYADWATKRYGKRQPRRKWWPKVERRLIRKKGDGRKIKLSCARYLNPYGSWGLGDEEHYSSVARRYHRGIKTSNERRANAGHVDEYGAEIVRGRRRGRNIPTRWDDPRVSSWDTDHSWKHHSKRRKQWIPK